jgi:prepilin-type N-terminal cleavage/methylation domain-containing protein
MKSSASFTLVELLAVIVIISLVAGMLSPSLQKVRAKAENAVCLSNLKQIGTAIWLWIPDNGSRYPRIQNDPSDPIYEEDDAAKTLLETLKPYGLTTNVLACPGDLKRGGKYFKKYTNSYECPPWTGDEEAISKDIPIYTRGGILQISASRVTLAWDYDDNAHSGEFNRLMADNTVQHRNFKPKYK